MPEGDGTQQWGPTRAAHPPSEAPTGRTLVLLVACETLSLFEARDRSGVLGQRHKADGFLEERGEHLAVGVCPLSQDTPGGVSAGHKGALGGLGGGWGDDG